MPLPKPPIPNLPSGSADDVFEKLKHQCDRASGLLKELRERIDRAASESERDSAMEALADKCHEAADSIADVVRPFMVVHDAVFAKSVFGRLPLKVSDANDGEAGGIARRITGALKDARAKGLEPLGKKWLENGRLLCLTLAESQYFDWGLIVVELTKPLELELKEKVLAPFESTLTGLGIDRNKLPLGDIGKLLGGRYETFRDGKSERMDLTPFWKGRWRSPTDQAFIIGELPGKLNYVAHKRNGAAHGSAGGEVQANEVKELSETILPGGQHDLLFRIVNLGR